ncbi:cation diffusion facilitator family transporter [Streptococcus caprae]|uniref:Cation diffusion facilitator family transporter n=1 Tax=Streptococcus caprae TaxID=1640501 RepID=A0ABV8CXQ2_9STRE
MSQEVENLKLAERGPVISIIAYILLALAKLVAGYSLGAQSLIADGFNNFSDIVSNVTLLIGLRLARKPADGDHKFGHWKIEDLASFITSILMFLVGFQVLGQTVQAILTDQQSKLDPIGAVVGVLSALVMFGVYLYNRKLAQTVKSGALIAAAKDNLSDAVTSLGTSMAILASALQFPILDRIMAIIITGFIFKTAYEIFRDSAFSLSDGFDDQHLALYEEAILSIPKITAVKSQRGRTYGSNIYLDLVLEMNPDLSVYESHAITEQVEELLHEQFGIYDIDIHVEPSTMPEDEIPANVEKKLIKYEKFILSKLPDYEVFISDDFQLIDTDGKLLSKSDIVARGKFYPSNFENFQLTTISQKTKLITYTLADQQHTSIWRRHEKWYLIFHQVTERY